MRGTLAVMQKELTTYFASPLAYVVIAIFLCVSGIFFSLGLFFLREASLRSFLPNLSVILLIIVPVITMRLFAEERGSGTIELLMTYPITDAQVVIGKFLAAFVLYLVMIGFTLLYALIVMIYGRPELGPILSGYLGVALMGACFLALGLFASSLARSQVVAAVLAFGLLLVLWIVDAAASALATGPVGTVLTYLSLVRHLDDPVKGVIDTRDLVYFASFIVISLFLTVRSVESARWK
ncbi:MAG: hypothetical protein C4289_07020 [Chloroflexota bacterium]